jgi:hypothetical protein
MESFKTFVNEGVTKVKPISIIDQAVAQQFADQINLALETKHIWNVDIKDLKAKINKYYERWTSPIQLSFLDAGRGKTYDPNNGVYDSEHEDLIQLYYDIPHSFAQLSKFTRTIKKSKHKVVKDQVKGFEEFHKYALAMKALKPYIEKGRKPNPNAVVKDKFTPDRLNPETFKLVQKALTDVIEEQYGDLVKSIKSQYEGYVNDYLDNHDGSKSPYDYFARSPQPRTVVGRLIVDADNPSSFKVTNPVKIKDYDKMLNSLAVAVVDDLKARYLIKNIEKVGSVIYKKTSPLKTLQSSGNLEGFGFNGEIKIKFEDGTGFTVRNKAVIVYSGYSDPFFRFPTTFHSVIFPDGSKKKMRSQEQMNKEWSIA